MTMVWVLVMVMHGLNGPVAYGMGRFPTYEACSAARQQVEIMAGLTPMQGRFDCTLR